MKLRHYTNEDYERVKEILELGKLYDPLWDTRSRLQEKIRRDPFSIIVAEEEKVVGVVYVLHDGWSAFISHLAVHPTHRNPGLGQLLMKEAEAELERRGIPEVSILVDELYPWMRQYHQDHGYRPADLYRCMFKYLNPASAEERIRTKNILNTDDPHRPAVVLLQKFRDKERRSAIETYRLIKELNDRYHLSLRVIPQNRADNLLNKSGEWEKLVEYSPFMVDAYVGYEKPGKKLRDKIIFSFADDPRIILPTWSYQGEKDIALMVKDLTVDDFVTNDGDIYLNVLENRLKPVEHFPKRCGWYLPNPETGIPSGKRTKPSPEARHLWRLDDACVSPVVRVTNDLLAQGDGRRYIDTNCRAPGEYGVVTEIPKSEVEKIIGIMAEDGKFFG